MKLKLDLHIHSIYSKDSNNTIDEIVNTLKKKEFHGYAITDHDTIRGIPEALKKKQDLILIPSLEISAKGAHILALDINENVTPNLSIPETIDIIHQQGATAVLAHPFRFSPSRISMKKVKEARLDGIEVANSAQFPYQYIHDLNRDLAEKLRLPQTGGSDSHIRETIGRAYTVIDSQSRETQDIIKSIEKGRTEVYGSGISLLERFVKIVRKKKKVGITLSN